MPVVRATGSRAWVVRVVINGQRRDIGLGSLKVLTPAEPRVKATEIRRRIAQGIDPVAQKVADPVPTFREAALAVHEEHKAAWKKGKFQDQWINTLPPTPSRPWAISC